MSFTVATFNVKNLIGPGQEFYRFLSYTPEEYAWKCDWLSDQMLAIDADIVGFQEIFEKEPLVEVVAECDAKGAAINAAAQPKPDAPYARRAIYRRLRFRPYGGGSVVFAPNIHDVREPGRRRPGVALVSRHPVREAHGVQDLGEDAIEMDLPRLGGGSAGHWRLETLSRPVLRVRLDVEGRALTVFNCHLKSKLGEFARGPEGHAPEEDLLAYDAIGRAAGELRAALRRMGEALALRRLVLAELATGVPVIVLGDLNDDGHAVSSQIIAGERPFHDYSWLRRHDAAHADDRYSRAEDARIQRAVQGARLVSAEEMFQRRALKDMIYTSAFGGVYQSIDQILLSEHFQPDSPVRCGRLAYLQVFNDHLADDSFEDAPYNRLASDHGQLVATLDWE